MNAIEQQLQVALDRAVPQHVARPGLVPAAIARATHIRKRRLATRSALGIVAVAGGAAVVAQRDVKNAPTVPDRVRQLASAQPSASIAAVGQPGITLTAVEGGCYYNRTPAPPEMGITGPCLRWVLETRRAGGQVETKSLMENYYTDASNHPLRTLTQDPVLGIELDGSRRTLTGRPDGPGRWLFDVVVPDGAELHILSLQTDDGAGMDCGDEPRPRPHC